MSPSPDRADVLGDAEVSSLPYERALEELDALIARLETGRVDLEEAVSCYERGTRLAQHCERLLDRTEQKVTQVVIGGGGEREQPFEPRPEPGAAAAVQGTGPGGREASQRARSVGGTPTRGEPLDPDDIPF